MYTYIYKKKYLLLFIHRHIFKYTSILYTWRMERKIIPKQNKTKQNKKGKKKGETQLEEKKNPKHRDFTLRGEGGRGRRRREGEGKGGD